jgi:uncharacterized protein involved in exopolysaccharide biosynthesis
MESERIAKLEAQVDAIKDDVKDLKDDVKEVHSRITTGNREIVDRIELMEQRFEQKLANNAVVSKEQHESMKTEIQADIKQIKDRVDILERWRWMIVGGAIAIGYIISHLLH